MTRNDIQKLITEHATGDADCVSVETGIETLGKLAVAFAPSVDTDGASIIIAIGRLLVAYGEHGTDPDGAASTTLYELLAAQGYDTNPED